MNVSEENTAGPAKEKSSRGPPRIKLANLLLVVIAVALVVVAIAFWLKGATARN